jgi:hypothetical protein
MHNPIQSMTLPSALELSKIEIHAQRGHMGPYSAQFAGLLALIRTQEAALAVEKSWAIADPSGAVDRLIEAAKKMLAESCTLVAQGETGPTADAMGALDDALAGCVGWPVPAAVTQPTQAAQQQCSTCSGTGLIDDGEIDCYPNGEPFENGPIKCVIDCPDCKRQPAEAPWNDSNATERLRSIVSLLGLQSEVPDGDLTGYEFPVLGMVRREIERLKAAAPVQAAVVPDGYVLVPAYDGADAVVSALYRRFKDWSKRGFGPDDVTWCEVKADIDALISSACLSPAPVQPAAAAPVEAVHDSVIRDIFMCNGFKIKEGQTDLKPYVYAAARELLAIQTTPAHAAPAKAVDERKKFESSGSPRGYVRRLPESGYGEYVDSITQAQWEGWQARAALAAPSEQVKS